MRASICRVSKPCATPRCAESGVRISSTRARQRHWLGSLDIGAAKAYASIRDMVADPVIDALWLTGPNHMRLENMEEIVARHRGRRGRFARHCLREAAGEKCR